jgi:hypothetical protein
MNVIVRPEMTEDGGSKYPVEVVCHRHLFADVHRFDVSKPVFWNFLQFFMNSGKKVVTGFPSSVSTFFGNVSFPFWISGIKFVVKPHEIMLL